MRVPRTGRAFGVVRMGAIEMETLHHVSRFDVNVSLKVDCC